MDVALLQRLLISNSSGDLALLSTFLQFHSVPSPLPLDVRSQPHALPQPQRQIPKPSPNPVMHPSRKPLLDAGFVCEP